MSNIKENPFILYGTSSDVSNPTAGTTATKTLDTLFTEIGIKDYVDKYNLNPCFLLENEGNGLVYGYHVTYNNIAFKIIREDNKFKISNLALVKYNTKTFAFYYEVIDKFFDVKIKSIEDSIKIFRNNTLKQAMLESGDSFEIEELLPDFISKTSPTKRDVVVLFDKKSGKNLKFCLSDISFEPKNLDKLFKGYVKPKNRRLTVGSEFLIKCNKFDKTVPLNTVGKVLAITDVQKGKLNYSKVEILNKNYNLILRQSKFKRIGNETVKEVKSEKTINKKSKLLYKGYHWETPQYWSSPMEQTISTLTSSITPDPENPSPQIDI